MNRQNGGYLDFQIVRVLKEPWRILPLVVRLLSWLIGQVSGAIK